MRVDVRTARERYLRVEAGLKALDAAARLPSDRPDDDPIFICAIGWRCGSTLLQRVLMTDPRVFIWGEPLDRLGLLSRITDMVAVVNPQWPPSRFWLTHRENVSRTGDWVANLYPDPSDFKAGLRGFFDGWLAAPARRDGFARWGAKEVRWSGEQARVLRWLYPSARFILIARHPVVAYASVGAIGLSVQGPGVWVTPDRILRGLEDYADFWNELALSWAEAAGPLNATAVRYEDLVSGRLDLAGLGRRLGLALDPGQALKVVAGGTVGKTPVLPKDAARINALTAEGRRAFGYGD